MPAPSIHVESTGTMAAVGRQPAERVRGVHLHSGNRYGGVETVLATLGRLNRRCPNLEQHFAFCYGARLSAGLTAADVPVHYLGPRRISRPWTAWRARRRLRRFLESEHFDAVICHMPWPLAVFGRTARAAGAKVAFWAHGFHSGSGWLERMASKTVPDVPLSTSGFASASVANMYPHTLVKAVYTPLALADSPEVGKWRTAVRPGHGVEDGQVAILQVSRFESLKGHLLHLQALSQLAAGSNWVCWFAGGPQNKAEQIYFREVQDTANRLGLAGRVRFLGQRSDVPQLLAAADIFCQPNQSPDAFGISFAAALWAGRPVITTALRRSMASDAGGASELIADSGNALAHPPDAAGALAKEIERRPRGTQRNAALEARVGAPPSEDRHISTSGARYKRVAGAVGIESASASRL